MSYNLEENVKEYFEFTLGNFVYKMKLPTMEEIEKLQKLDDDDKRGKELIKFISSDNPEAPNIEEALKTKSIHVTRNFRRMIEAEMGA